MSRWDDQFEAHPVFQALANMRQQLDAVDGQIEDASQRESHSRLVRVCDYLEAALRAADPELVPLTVLDQLANGLNQVIAQLGQFAATPSAPPLDQANAQADTLLQQALMLAPRRTPEEVQDLQTAVTTFRRSAGQHLRNIEAETEAVKAKSVELATALAEQEAKIQAQDARLDTVVIDYQGQFSAAQDQRQTQFAQAIDEVRTETREVLAETRANAKAAVDEATEQLAELLSEAENKSSEALAVAQQRADAQHEKLTAESGAKMNELDALLAKAVKTVGAIGSTGMAGGYKIVADDEKKQADRLRIVALLALLGAIAATVFAVAHGVYHGFQVDTFFAKWAISIPFAALASYAAVESSKHRERATANRKIELQLASLDTYLVNLDEQKQEEIKAKLADRFFGELPARIAEGGLPELSG